MNINRFTLARQAQTVQRYHIERTIRRQSVGEHTFGVLCVAMELSNGSMSAALVSAILHHDVPEAITGDVPATARWKSPALQASLALLDNEVIERYGLQDHELLSPAELRILKLSDLLELVMFCIEDAEMGNVNAMNIANRAWDSLWDNYLGADENTVRITTMSGKFKSEAERELISYIEQRHETVRRFYERGR